MRSCTLKFIWCELNSTNHYYKVKYLKKNSQNIQYFYTNVCAVDQQSKYPGSNPGAFEIVLFSTERFSNSLNLSM